MSKFFACGPLVLTTLVLTFCVSGGAQAGTLKTIYSFCSGPHCPDGSYPQARLLMDTAGNLYGTTSAGGKEDAGFVFELIPNSDTWSEKILHRFCKNAKCRDGAMPTAGLIMDQNGNLYGTTWQGGKHLEGVVFELVRSADGTTWAYSKLHDFCPSCGDGQNPEGVLSYAGAANGTLYDGTSPLYGTTETGSANNAGIVYALDPRTGTGKWPERVIYTFCSQANCVDGGYPGGGVVVDGKGNLYGSGQGGGANQWGVLFELAPDSVKKHWTETVLYNFCSAANCSDGAYPGGDLLLDSAGNIFGTAPYSSFSSYGGVVFKLVPNGAQSRYSVLYTFCSKANCLDGAEPYGSGLVMDNLGNLFGTTEYGGKSTTEGSENGGGTIFEISGKREHILYNFCTKNDCSTGANPEAGLILGPGGQLYGTTFYGGHAGQGAGTVFELSP